jgi:hypothetical protein
LTVASERQIAANRRNAGKSTGPRSGAGKTRASRNARSHGLSLYPSSAAFAKQVEGLARKIAGRSTDAITLEHARVAAEAELELDRVRRVRLALIERTSSLGSLEAPTHFPSADHEVRWLIVMDIWMTEKKGRRPRWPILQDPSATMPTQEPHRASEAVRRILPDLIKLDRYESRAVSRRDKAIRQITKRCAIK